MATSGQQLLQPSDDETYRIRPPYYQTATLSYSDDWHVVKLPKTPKFPDTASKTSKLIQTPITMISNSQSPKPWYYHIVFPYTRPILPCSHTPKFQDIDFTMLSESEITCSQTPRTDVNTPPISQTPRLLSNQTPKLPPSHSSGTAFIISDNDFHVSLH